MVEIYIDLYNIRKWADKGWCPTSPEEWTPGVDGYEYLVWRGYNKMGEFIALGYLDSIDGPMKPIGTLLLIGRKKTF